MMSNRTITCSVLIASALVLGLLASPASARSANFDKPIMGASDGVNTTLALEIKNGDPGDTVEIRWEKPAGSQVGSTQVVLSDVGGPFGPRGTYSGNWFVAGVPSAVGDQDKLILVHDPGGGNERVTDQELAEWVQGAIDVERASLGTGSAIPTVSQWGLIIMALLLLTAGTIIIRRRKLATA